MRPAVPRLYQTGTPAESMIIPNWPSVGSLLLLARMYQPGGASPSPVVVIVGKSGGTHRIQYSSVAPPPVGVMRTTIASLASIVSVVSTTCVPPAEPDGDGGARHAADVHGQLVGRRALAVRDVVVLRRR